MSDIENLSEDEKQQLLAAERDGEDFWFHPKGFAAGRLHFLGYCYEEQRKMWLTEKGKATRALLLIAQRSPT